MEESDNFGSDALRTRRLVTVSPIQSTVYSGKTILYTFSREAVISADFRNRLRRHYVIDVESFIK